MRELSIKERQYIAGAQAGLVNNREGYSLHIADACTRLVDYREAYCLPSHVMTPAVMVCADNLLACNNVAQ